jgi:hypothetical protein
MRRLGRPGSPGVARSFERGDGMADGTGTAAGSGRTLSGGERDRLLPWLLGAKETVPMHM